MLGPVPTGLRKFNHITCWGIEFCKIVLSDECCIMWRRDLLCFASHSRVSELEKKWYFCRARKDIAFWTYECVVKPVKVWASTRKRAFYRSTQLFSRFEITRTIESEGKIPVSSFVQRAYVVTRWGRSCFRMFQAETPVARNDTVPNNKPRVLNAQGDMH